MNAVAIHKPRYFDCKLLYSRGGFTPPMDAALCGKSDLVKVLINRGALINLDIDNNHNNVLSRVVLNESGWQKPLHMQTMLKSVIKLGADLAQCRSHDENQIQALLDMSSEGFKTTDALKEILNGKGVRG